MHSCLPWLFRLDGSCRDDACEAAQEARQIETQNALQRLKVGPELWFRILNESN